MKQRMTLQVDKLYRTINKLMARLCGVLSIKPVVARLTCTKKYGIALILLHFSFGIVYSQDSHTDNIVKEIPSSDKLHRMLHIKTNLPALGLAIANVAIELDLAKHWSINLPIYYSAWDYFTSTTKFRTFAVRPEVRYWFDENNGSWFVAAHLGMAYYNVATNGEYRIQDHDESSPALGGGLNAGYRFPISKDNHWKMEVSVGAGAYALHYNKFRNKPDGLLVETKKKTYLGIDQIAVSLAYTFDLNKKGGDL